MGKRGLIAVFGAVLFAFAAVSCSDDDDEEYLYLDGTLKFGLDEFVAQYSTVTLSPSGVSHPDGGEITYIWTVAPDIGSSFSDTTFEFSYTFSDTLQSYKFTCAATADDYVSSTSSITTTVVLGGLDGNGSITDSLGNAILNLATLACIADEREDTVRTYYYTGIGNYDWFVQNLAYRGTETGSSVGIPYANCEVTNDVFGTYYSYYEAMEACPDGWELPSVSQWEECIETASGGLMGNVYFNGAKMWEFWPDVTISNSTMFTAIPSGEANLSSGTFSGIYERAVFWTSTEFDEDSTKAVVKYFMDDQPAIYDAYMDKASFGASVRCVRKGKSVIPFE